MSRDRVRSLDLCRALACLLVLVTHSLSFSEILDCNIKSPEWFGCLLVRYFAMICVPMFLILSGFLQNKKQPTGAYFKKIIPLALSYVIISFASGIAKSILSKTAFDFFGVLRRTFEFSENSYSWYFEMYLGLFFLIPFINIAWNAIKTQRQKLLLVGIVSFLAFMPSLSQSFIVNGTYLYIFPKFFKNIYPIAYYLLGAYICEYKTRVNKWLCAAVGLAALLASAGLCFVFSSETERAWWVLNGYDAPSAAVIAVCAFLILYNIKIKPKALGYVFTEISVCSFEIYLFSYLSDEFVYQRFSYPLPALVLLSFVSAYAAARVLRLILHPVNKIMKM